MGLFWRAHSVTHFDRLCQWWSLWSLRSLATIPNKEISDAMFWPHDQSCFFFSHILKRLMKWPKKITASHFSQNVRKYRLKNTVMVSFNTTVRQMTKIFQWPKCLSRNDQNVSTKKKTGPASRKIGMVSTAGHTYNKRTQKPRTRCPN